MSTEVRGKKKKVLLILLLENLNIKELSTIRAFEIAEYLEF